MIINPTKIYEQDKVKCYLGIVGIILCIISVILLPFKIVPLIISIGFIYSIHRYYNRMITFMIFHGVKTLDTNKLDKSDKSDFEDIGFF